MTPMDDPQQLPFGKSRPDAGSQVRAEATAGPTSEDRWMERCLQLARRGAGLVSPNPLVGAVLVSGDGEVLGEGWHGQYGGPHAEVWAVRDVLKRHGAEVLRSAKMYVNLEPCNHRGKTPPCTDLILEAGIPDVVIGMIDPFPGVAGSGVRRLREKGVGVRVGALELPCRRLNEPFTRHLVTGRPLVTLKVAQSLDGQVATETGDSQWITGADARRLVHIWRSQLDAVLIGSGTARRDDPTLTVRHVAGRQPIRIVVDGRGELRPDLHLFSDTHARETIAVIAEDVDPAYAGRLAHAGGRLLRIGCLPDGRLNLEEMFVVLGEQGGRDGLPLQSVLVEAGPGLATVLFRMNLVDRYFLIIAARLLGAGIPSMGSLGVTEVDQAVTFAESEWEQVGEDMLFKGYKHPLT